MTTRTEAASIAERYTSAFMGNLFAANVYRERLVELLTNAITEGSETHG